MQLPHHHGNSPSPLPLVECIEHGEMITGSVSSKPLVGEGETLLARRGEERLGEAGAGSYGAHCISNSEGGREDLVSVAQQAGHVTVHSGQPLETDHKN